MPECERQNQEVSSCIDNFLKEEGMLDDAQAQAVKEIVAWLLTEAIA